MKWGIAASMRVTLMEPRTSPSAENALSDVAWVHELARQLVADADLADDLAQDALLAAHRRGLEGAAPSRSWIAAVMRNGLKHFARSRAHRLEREQEGRAPRHAAAVDACVIEIEAHQRLLQAVHDLEPDLREVIALRFLRELPPRRIAAQLGVPAATVSQRITSALRKLRREHDAQFGERSRWALLLVPAAPAPSPLTLPVGALALHVKSILVGAGALCGAIAYFVHERGAEPPLEHGTVAAAPEVRPPVSHGNASSPLDDRAPATPDIVAPRAAGGQPGSPQVDASLHAVRGRVFDASGVELPGVRVGVRDLADTTSGAGGEFVFERVPKGEIELAIQGDGSVPMEFDLGRVGDPHAVHIEVDLRCTFELTLLDPLDRADRLRVEDGRGAALDLLVIRERSVNAYADRPIESGRTGVLTTSSRARTLVLTRAGRDVARLPLRLSPGAPAQSSW